jgi:NTP pyrophosphatase (non-canonical NTP hydrolase)
MNLTDEFKSIRDWANERGLYEKGDPKTQFIKLQEEVGELAQAILKDNEDEFEDAIGDCVVVLTNLAALKGFYIEDCINQSYEVITKRKGQVINGTFVKDK